MALDVMMMAAMVGESFALKVMMYRMRGLRQAQMLDS